MAANCREYSVREALVRSPLVSVIMPAYNHQKYIAYAIEGVIAQTADFPIELIVADDCSPDLTASIALSFLSRIPEKIRVLRWDRNVGMHENAHQLLRSARGRYIAFCEGDDYWHRSDKLSKEVHVLESLPALGLVCSNWRTVANDGTIIANNVLGLAPHHLFALDLDHILEGWIKTASVCARADLLKQVLQHSALCRPGRYPFGDAPMWVEISRFGSCCCLTDELATYRLSSNSATRPRNIMDVYRFVSGAAEFKWDVLSLYSLRGGAPATKQAKLLAARARLRASAMLGDSDDVQEQLNRIRALDSQLTVRDCALRLLAYTTRPGHILGTIFRSVLVFWHSMVRRHLLVGRGAEAHSRGAGHHDQLSPEHVLRTSALCEIQDIGSNRWPIC